jgi:KipI family sensor histidine kinase inhibitor
MTMSFQAVSDQSLLITLGEGINLATNRHVAALTRAFQAACIPGVRNLHPAYASLLVVFDSLALDHTGLEAIARRLLAAAEGETEPAARTVEIPVAYEGPDLGDVAALTGLSEADVVEIHSHTIYTVYFIGFVPGFAYLGDLPDQIAVPRLAAPRKQVPAGSVAIGGKQTGVYPMTTPGGWRIIGHTAVELFNAGRPNMSLLEIGDQVRFIPI